MTHSIDEKGALLKGQEKYRKETKSSSGNNVLRKKRSAISNGV